MNMFKRFVVAAAVAAIGLVSLQSAVAATTGVSSLGALGANDTIDWGTLGPAGNGITNPTASTSVGGQGYIVSQDVVNAFRRIDQNSGWSGNFAPGATLLWTDGNNGPMSISFANGIFGAGAQIQANFGGAFVARLEAFDSGLNSLGFYTLDGNSTGAGDNSAIFIGLSSTTDDIWSITFSLDSAFFNPGDFAIGNVGLVTTAIPEPEIYAMLAAGLGLMGFVARRRKQKIVG